MPSNVGPKDGRKARRKRCDACFKRKIKCHGSPCEYCKRTNQPCTTPAKPTTLMPIFITQTSRVGGGINLSDLILPRFTTFPLLQSPCSKRSDWNGPYFFTSFLPMTALTSDIVSMSADLSIMSKTSPALRDAMHAVANLHRSRQEQSTLTVGSEHYESSEVLQAYNRAVHSIQSLIVSNKFLDDPSALWTTFLLGLLELMRDETGENWLSHFLHGTCMILRIQRPESLTRPDLQNQQRRTFFLATRIFEIARALVYSESTFLSEPEWKAALENLWEGDTVALWHPKEALFDMLPSISDLSIRALHFCKNVTQVSMDERYLLVQSLAEEGMVLQRSLQKWWEETSVWERTFPEQCAPFKMPRESDYEMLVAYLYYHAISIYLSGTYDYHIHWRHAGAPCTPILPRSDIEWRVSEILRISHELLTYGAAGVLLFFPLRVAGARAADLQSRGEILNLFRTITRRGFLVAKIFKEGLLNLWSSKNT